MKTILILLIVSACGIMTLGCKSPSGNTPQTRRNLLGRLKEWPDSLTIERFYYGGMLPESENIRITSDSCIAEYKSGQLKNIYRFAMQQEQLNALLGELNTHHLDNITLRKTDGIIYDAPTHGIRMTLGRISITLSNSASEEIDPRHQEDFRQCYAAIGTVVSDHNQANSISCCFIPDERIRRLPHTYLSIIPEGQPESFGDSCHSLPEKICMKFWPGHYSFQVHLTRKGKVSYTEYLASTYPVMNLQRDTLMQIIMPGDSSLLIR